MATPKVLIKRSSVAGRVPSAGDLDYGELAINFEDGKIYYKDASNNIKAFIDSARVQTIADAVETMAGAQLDSAEVTQLIDSDYVQVRVPESYLSTIIDSAYVQARQSSTGSGGGIDSAAATTLINSSNTFLRKTGGTISDGELLIDSTNKLYLGDSNFYVGGSPSTGIGTIRNAGGTLRIQSNAIQLNNITNVGLLSTDTLSISLRHNGNTRLTTTNEGVNITGKINTLTLPTGVKTLATTDDVFSGNYNDLSNTPTLPSLGTDFVDSAQVEAIVDSAYIQLRQTDIRDSAFVSTIIVSDVTKSFIDSLNVNADTLDGFEGTHYLQYSNLTGAPVVLDSAMIYRFTIDSARVTGLVDSAYVTARAGTGTDSATVSAIIIADVDSNYVQARQSTTTPTITIQEEGSSLATAASTLNFIGSAVTASGTGATKDITITVPTFGTDFVDSDAVLSLIASNRHSIDSGYFDANVPTFGTDFVDSTAVTTLITSTVTAGYIQTRQGLIDSGLVTQLVDSAYVALRDKFNDSDGVLQFVDSDYVQARQRTYNTSDFVDSAFVTGQNVSTFANDAKYLDSTTGQNLIDSAYVQLHALDGDKSLNGLKALQFIHDSDAATYTVTVATKDASHRYQGTGSGSGYKIDGTFAPTIVMNPGNTYRFDLSDATNSSHPLYFYYDAAKTTQYTTNVVNNYASKGAGSSGSYIEITITDATPPVLHYQCGNHGYMGNMITTQTRNLTGFDTDDLSEGSTNQYHTTARVNTAIDNRVDRDFVRNLDAYNTSDFIDSTYFNANIPTFGTDFVDSAYVEQNSLDSERAINLIDSAYVQARQSGGEITIQDEGSALSTAATTLNFVGSAVTASGTGTTKTITISQAEGGTDSATVSAIIIADVDSAYVQARQTTGGGGLDSALVTQLVDSSYVQVRVPESYLSTIVDSAYVTARQSGTVNITDAITQTVFYYTADSGQTTFSGADDDGGTLAYTTNKVAVYINGLYQQETADYTATNGTSVVLTEAADSGDIIAIETLAGSNLTSQPIFRKVFHYTADSGQTAFNGADDFGDTLTYTTGRVQAYLNGIMLVSATDFTATDGSTLTLTVGADSGDVVSIEKFDGTGMGIDSSIANALTDARVTRTFVRNLDAYTTADFPDSDGVLSLIASNRHSIDSAYFDANVPTFGTDFVDSDTVLSLIASNRHSIDSAYFDANVPTFGTDFVDSAFVTGQNYITGITIQEEGSSLSTGATTLNFVGSQITATGTGATKTITVTAGGGGTDSAATIDLIDDQLAVFSVGDLVGADGNPGDALISDGDGTASWNGNVALSYEFKVNYDSLGVISSVSDLPTGFTADSTGSNSIIISHNTGRSVKDISYNSYVSGTLKLRHPSRDSADVVTYAVADRLNKFTATVGIANTGADADQYAWVNITF